MIFGLPFQIAARLTLFVATLADRADDDQDDDVDEPAIMHVETEDARHVLAEVDGDPGAWIASRRTLPLEAYR